MAKPQTENGYTKIANELLDALCRIRISGEAQQVLNVIYRKTYGFNKKQDKISLSQFSLATGLKRPTICKALNKLKSMNLIFITNKDNRECNMFIFNKDFDTWIPLPKKVTLPKKIMAITKKGNASLPKKPHTKDNTTKDTITKDSSGASPLIPKIIKLFEVVNPNCKTMYGNTTQRKAIIFLLEEYGFETIKKVIALLPKTNTIAYLPTVTTPVQLKDKWASLESGLRKEKGKIINNYQGVA